MNATRTARSSGRSTRRYEHTPTGQAWWFYDSFGDDEVIAERISNGDKMRFESWSEVETSEYWEWVH